MVSGKRHRFKDLNLLDGVIFSAFTKNRHVWIMLVFLWIMSNLYIKKEKKRKKDLYAIFTSSIHLMFLTPVGKRDGTGRSILSHPKTGPFLNKGCSVKKYHRHSIFKLVIPEVAEGASLTVPPWKSNLSGLIWVLSSWGKESFCPSRSVKKQWHHSEGGKEGGRTPWDFQRQLTAARNSCSITIINWASILQLQENICPLYQKMVRQMHKSEEGEGCFIF